MATSPEQAAQLFAEAAAIMHRLRAPGGCPWDREQTFASIRRHTLEETYEVLDAIEREDWANLCEELGDLLLQVLFYAEMAEEAGRFSLAAVLEGLNRKLIRRHPHVFGAEASAAAGNQAGELPTPEAGEAVVANWQRIKELEKKAQPQPESLAGRLAEVARGQGALVEAKKLGNAAAGVGFDWPDHEGWMDAVASELEEVRAELAPAQTAAARLHEEYGDLLFTVANLGRKLHLDPEMALRDANAKFRRRFAAMETGSPRPLSELTLDELDGAWKAAKALEGKPA